MAYAKPELPVSADPLGETLHLLRLTGMLYCRAELTAPWGIEMPPMPGCMMFQVITAGRGWLELPGEAPRLLQPGSLALIPHGAGHCVRSDLEASARSLYEIPVERISDRYEIMRHGGGGEVTLATCGVVRFDHAAAQHLIALLPKVVQVDTWDDEDDSWLHSTLRLIAREAKALRPGGETVITRLADVLIIQALRSWIDTAPEAETGWLAALRDEQVGRALAAVHRAPQMGWTVALLASKVGMSRSAFSARFTDLVGKPAMRYVTQWRMQLAHAQLRERPEPLSELAGKLGYASEAAFCRAFKREFGVPPGSVAHGAAAPQTGSPAAP